MAPRRRIAYWLLGCFAVTITLFLVLLSFVDSDTLKAKLQATVETQTGGQFDYQQVELSFLPRPSITLHQVKLDIPEQIQGTAGFIQASPDLLALLTGQVRLAELVLESPDISLNLADAHGRKEDPPSDLTLLSLQRSLAKGLEPLVTVAPDLALVINNGTLTLNQSNQVLGLFKNVALKLDLDAADSRSLQGRMQGSVSDFTLQRNGHSQSLEKLALSGMLRSDEKTLSLTIDSLTLAKPALQIKGKLASNPVSPAFEILLNGVGLDVDAIRKTALALAGDISLVNEIFDYLRGGTVPQLSFHSQGETAPELGDLKNIVIKGHLQAGAVSIPEIKLDLTEVVGDVLVTDGVLQGTGMSTRLEGSNGHDGTLKVALAEGEDLFQLELMLNADLAQAQRILSRIVQDPEFVQHVDKITNLKGSSVGKLTLGDSLKDINARVDVSALNLSADYQGLPFPVGVTKGQLSFAENLIELKDISGTFGRSTFSEVICNIDLKDVLQLGLSSGKFGLVLDELYPWVASLEGAGESLNKIKQVTGQLDLAALSLKGAVDAPNDWQLAATGTINDLNIELPQSRNETELTKDDSSEKNVSIDKSPGLTFDVEYIAEQLQIKQLLIKDQHSDTDAAFIYGHDELSLNFTGNLHHKTIESIFHGQQFATGQLKGDFAIKVPLENQTAPVAKGQLSGENLVVPMPSGVNLEVGEVTLVAEGTQVRVDAPEVVWNDLTWKPFKATVDFDQDKIEVSVTDAKLCGIDSSGTLTVIDKDLALDFTIEGKGVDVVTSYSCLREGRVKMTGSLDFFAEITSRGPVGELPGTMQGPLEMTFTNGSIEQSKLLARTLEVLNVTEIVKGRLPDLGSTGFDYSKIELQGNFQGEKLVIEKIFMDGETLDVLGQGELDFGQETVDIELLAAPFKTVDTVVKHIPGINYLLAGSLVTIPVSVKGDQNDPRVRVMSASSVGSGLLGLGGRIIKSPLKLIETIVPEENEPEEAGRKK